MSLMAQVFFRMPSIFSLRRGSASAGQNILIYSKIISLPLGGIHRQIVYPVRQFSYLTSTGPCPVQVTPWFLLGNTVSPISPGQSLTNRTENPDRSK